MDAEAIKCLNLVDFLSLHYGLQFRPSGQGAVCRSPFTADRHPSFFVRLVDGHWLFKDFSSGLGGSLIDFVQKIEGLSDLSEVFRKIEQLVGRPFSHGDTSHPAVEEHDRGYDVDTLYSRFQGEDPAPCRRYLVGRGIDPALVDDLIIDGEVVHNRYQGRSWCCFAVRDGHGRLQCLDNHEIDGPGKFVLGVKSIFSRDWPLLKGSAEVFVCEGIIDYLSIKTLEKDPLPGFALLGNQLLFARDLLAGCKRIVAALDEDRGGSSALYDLMEAYPDQEITVYDLQGYKDPNELLQAGAGARQRLTAEDRLKLYEEFQRADNKAALARKWGIDRSYMYQLVKECRQMLFSSLRDRSPGRKPAGQPGTMRDAWEQIKELREDVQRLTIERDTLHCREELLGVRLKWAEIQVAELRNEPVDTQTGPQRKPQIKKKKKKRRLRR